MDWKINEIRVFTQEFGGDDDQIIARLNPLGGGTILHKFGYDEEISKLKGIVVGDTDMDAIKVLRTTGNSYELKSIYGVQGDYFVKHVSWKMLNSICQTLRPDLDEDAPVYSVELELYEDV